jgi:hypothetical protein
MLEKLLGWIKSETDISHKDDVVYTRSKLTRANVLMLIERNGGPEGLDLSGYDLSGINLSKLDLHGIIFGNTQILDSRTVRKSLLEEQY